MTQLQTEKMDRRLALAVAIVVILGFAARLWAASGTFLNPDEALHFRLANQASLALAYKQGMTASHPPLLFALLYFWRAVGTSELCLRLPSVLAGTAFCWFFFEWLTRVAGRLAGFVGLLLVTLLPPIVLLSAEVRQYALLLAFLGGALYFLERALDENSAGLMVAFSACLYLAMLSHYSSLMFAAALGLYALLRIVRQIPPIGVAASWAAGQVGALSLFAFLYRTHLSRLGAGESRTVLQGWMSEFYLRHSYFERGHDNLFLFLLGHSFGVFQFVFGQLAIGDLMGLMFLAGVSLLLTQRANASHSRQLAWFLLLPFALACGASLAHVYPYGGTRHSAYLVIPAVAGVSVAVVWLSRQRWSRAVALTLLVVAVCVIFGKQRQPYMSRRDQSQSQMTAAMDFLRQQPASSLIFTDYQSNLLLGHYLCRQRPISFELSSPDREVFSCDGRRVISAGYRVPNIFSADIFLQQWNFEVTNCNLKAGDTVWVFQAGWGVNLPEDLRTRSPEFRHLHFESFGNNIKIFKMAVDSAHASARGPVTVPACLVPTPAPSPHQE